jgi:hypothetical protein
MRQSNQPICNLLSTICFRSRREQPQQAKQARKQPTRPHNSTPNTNTLGTARGRIVAYDYYFLSQSLVRGYRGLVTDSLSSRLIAKESGRSDCLLSRRGPIQGNRHSHRPSKSKHKCEFYLIASYYLSWNTTTIIPPILYPRHDLSDLLD